MQCWACDGGFNTQTPQLPSRELLHLCEMAEKCSTAASTCFDLLWLGQHVVASLCLDLMDNAGVDLDLECLSSIFDWHLDATITLANWCEDRVLLQSRDAIMMVCDQPKCAAGVVDSQVKGVEVGHGMTDTSKRRAIIWKPDTHLHAISLHSDCVNASLLKATDEDIAGDDLVTPDQGLWVVRSQDDNVSSKQDLEQWLLELGMDLDVEDRLADADPVLECRMVLDCRCVADKLYRGHGLEHLQQVSRVHADVPRIKVMWTHEGQRDLSLPDRLLLGHYEKEMRCRKERKPLSAVLLDTCVL